MITSSHTGVVTRAQQSDPCLSAITVNNSPNLFSTRSKRQNNNVRARSRRVFKNNSLTPSTATSSATSSSSYSSSFFLLRRQIRTRSKSLGRQHDVQRSATAKSRARRHLLALLLVASQVSASFHEQFTFESVDYDHEQRRKSRKNKPEKTNRQTNKK